MISPMPPQPPMPKHEKAPVSTVQLHQAIRDAKSKSEGDARAFLNDKRLGDIISAWFDNVPRTPQEAYDFLREHMQAIEETLNLNDIERKVFAHRMLDVWASKVGEERRKTWSV